MVQAKTYMRTNGKGLGVNELCGYWAQPVWGRSYSQKGQAHLLMVILFFRADVYDNGHPNEDALR
jgi:hypothetical protein